MPSCRFSNPDERLAARLSGRRFYRILRRCFTALSRLLAAPSRLGDGGFRVLAEAFLPRFTTDPARPAALVLDVGLPGLDGLALQRSLAARSDGFAIVFLTGRGDIPMSVSAMKAGAVDFLTKPVGGEVLIAAVREALARADRSERRMAHEDVGEFRAAAGPVDRARKTGPSRR